VHQSRVPLAVRLILWRGRRLGLAAAVVALCLLVARQLAPPPEATEPVVVTAREVPAGGVLAAADLRIARLPHRLAPDGAMTDLAELRGHELLIDLPRGVPVVASMLDDGRFGRVAPAGTVTVPVRLVDAAVTRLLRPGDRIDLVAPGYDPDGTSAVVVAQGAVVLDVVAPDDADAGDLWGAADEGSDAITVVAVSPEEGHRLAGSGWGSLGAVLVTGS
jgi:Flp pilus assembly protein CpaB